MAVIKFLAGLKSDFEPIRSQMLGGASLPTLAKTYQHVLRSTSHVNDPSPSTLVTNHSALVPQASQTATTRGDGPPRRGRGGYRGGYRGGAEVEVVALIAQIVIRMVIPKNLVGISLVGPLVLHILLLLVTRLHLLMLLL